jgi:hypothetical protein
MFRRYFLFLAGLGIAACEGPTTPTPTVIKSGSHASFSRGNTTKFNDVFDISTATDNSCNGDILFVSGKAHEVFTIIDNGSSADLRIHVNFDDLKGVGVPSGVLYHLNVTEKQNEHDIFVPDFTFQATAQFNQEVVSQGNAPNLIYHVTQQYSFDGITFTVINTRFSIECRG